MVTRIVAGVALVFGGSVLVARLSGPDDEAVDVARLPAFRLDRAPFGFAGALVRLAVTLIPAYVIVVFLFALFRGWLFPVDGSAAHWGILAIVGAAILGTLVVIPTGGEIPILQGLAPAGVSAGVQGALLISLPVISIVSMAMVVRELKVRVTVGAAVGVALTSICAGVLLAVLTS